MNTVINKIIFLSFLFFSDYALASTEADKKEIQMAEKSIFWTLIASGSPEGQRACAENSLACSDDRASLGLALLASKTSRDALTSLAELIKYRMDGGLSEDHLCYVLSKKKTISTPLSMLNSEALRRKCIAEAKNAAMLRPTMFLGIDPLFVCTSTNEIENRKLMLQRSVRMGSVCQE